jgi:hypothetical protein
MSGPPGNLSNSELALESKHGHGRVTSPGRNQAQFEERKLPLVLVWQLSHDHHRLAGGDVVPRRQFWYVKQVEFLGDWLSAMNEGCSDRTWRCLLFLLFDLLRRHLVLSDFLA